jgi:hypothetical protein
MPEAGSGACSMICDLTSDQGEEKPDQLPLSSSSSHGWVRPTLEKPTQTSRAIRKSSRRASGDACAFTPNQREVKRESVSNRPGDDGQFDLESLVSAALGDHRWPETLAANGIAKELHRRQWGPGTEQTPGPKYEWPQSRREMHGTHRSGGFCRRTRDRRTTTGHRRLGLAARSPSSLLRLNRKPNDSRGIFFDRGPAKAISARARAGLRRHCRAPDR